MMIVLLLMVMLYMETCLDSALRMGSAQHYKREMNVKRPFITSV